MRERIPIEGWMMLENKRYGELMIDNHWMDKSLKEVLMIDELSIIETNKVNHIVETDMKKFVVEIKYFGMSFDEFDKETRSSDGLQPNQMDLNYVHALNEPHLHEIHVVPNKNEADRRKSIQKLRVHLKLFQFHVVDVYVIE
ncbi:hypothetical protein Tco_1319245 [Tanacetum coccineum]